MADIKNVKDKDLYALIGVKENATPKEITKAYRKKALKLHPDKNPDNPHAASMFHELSEALKILTDLGARAAYDHVRKAKQAAAARTAKLDDKRKKVKLDLEERERAAEAEERASTKASRTLEQEIQRLREEGSQILQQEQDAMKNLLKEEAEARRTGLASSSACLRARWRLEEEDRYTEEKLLEIFKKHGDVVAVIVSTKKKKGNAIVEFKTGKDAERAFISEIGFPDNPLSLSWVSGKPTHDTAYAEQFKAKLLANNSSTTESRQNRKPTMRNNDDDFEAMVLQKMREKQARKRNQASQEEG